MSKSPEQEIREMAVEACKLHSDIDSAILHVQNLLKRKKSMRNRIVKTLLERAIRAEVHNARHRTRSKIKQGASNCNRPVSAIGAVVSACREVLMDEWYVGNKKLGETTPEELIPEIRKNREQGYGKLAVADFYEEITLRVPPKTIVYAKLSISDLERIWNQVESRYKRSPSVKAKTRIV